VAPLIDSEASLRRVMILAWAVSAVSAEVSWLIALTSQMSFSKAEGSPKASVGTLDCLLKMTSG
jgi:hypothetical protein